MKPADIAEPACLDVHGMDFDVLRAVRLFLRETWPGEPAGEPEETWLAVHADRVASGGGRCLAPSACGGGFDRRMQSALAVCRLTRRVDIRRLAWRGWLRGGAAAFGPESSWSLRLSPIIPEPLELAAFLRLRRVMEGLSELWPPGGRPVLALWDPPPWVTSGGATRPDVLRCFCRQALARAGAERNWSGEPDVLLAPP